MTDLIKFRRGSVWFIKGGRPGVGHEQAKNRPWVVVSNDKFNVSSSMITAAPLTSRNYTASPVHVLFKQLDGTANVILCEQLRTFDTSAPDYTFEYMGQLSEDVVSAIDEKLAIQLALPVNNISMTTLLNTIDSVVAKMVNAKVAAMGAKFSDDDVLNFAGKLQELTDTTVSELIDLSTSGTVPTTSVDAAEDTTNVSEPASESFDTDSGTFESTTTETSNSIDQPSITSEKPKRIKWTRELAQSFVDDANTLPMKKVMEKWGMSKKPRFYSMKKYAEDLLQKTNEQD